MKKNYNPLLNMKITRGIKPYWHYSGTLLQEIMITLLRIKNIRLEKYGEGELPYEAKAGNGPILLTLSFPYVRDWLNEHPFRNEVKRSSNM
jgi:hypothetical protein